MAECGEDERNERTSFVSLNKSRKTYGATSINSKCVKDNLKCIKHTVMPQDTLQGIALKYGVTTQEIRRINKIWLNDSLYLRPLLDIPLLNESQSEMKSSNEEFASNSQSKDTELTLSDILGRIDTTIAETKHKVEQMESNNENFNLFHNKSLLRASSDPSVVPHPVIISQGKKIRSSLQRLEQRQDELFEL